MLQNIGESQVLFRTGYPHSDGTRPDSQFVASRLFSGLEADVSSKNCRNNAIGLCRLSLKRDGRSSTALSRVVPKRRLPGVGWSAQLRPSSNVPSTD
jgi:hypothetical protein